METATASSRSAVPFSTLVARNTGINLLAQVLLLILAVVCMPPLVTGLGGEGFGLLSLVWAVVGYFSLLDLGVSKAVTKFLSEYFALGRLEAARRVTWGSIAFSGLIGAAGGGAAMLAAPWLVADVLRVSPAYHGEALHAFRLAGAGIPFMLVFGTLRSVQMAAQHFGVVNGLQVGLGLAQWLGAVIVVWSGGGLLEVVAITLAGRVGFTCLAFALLPRSLPGAFSGIRLWESAERRQVFSYGGWVSLSQIVAPLFLYLDRYLIAVFYSVEAVTLYTIPQEAFIRLLVIPMSLTTTLFPALSHTAASRGPEAMRVAALRSLRYLSLLLIPISMVCILFADVILGEWMGPEFARSGSAAFRILAAGFFVCGLAQVPMTALLALGRPDLPAKYHMIELPVLVGLNALLIPVLGIAGAALVWTTRVALDAALLLTGLKRALPGGSARESHASLRRMILPVAVFLAALLLLAWLDPGPVLILSLTLAAFATYLGLVWRYGLDDADRTLVRKVLQPFRGQA